jgi:hypothetical protein
MLSPEACAPALAVRRKRPLPCDRLADMVGSLRKSRRELSPCAAGLLGLPEDVLRYRILSPEVLDFSTLGVCRFVCRKLRNMLPRKLFPPGRWRMHSEKPTPQAIGGCLVSGATAQGHLAVLKWALKRKTACRSHRSELDGLAAASGQLRVLKWLVQETGKTYVYWDSLFSEAVEKGHLEVAKWLLPYLHSPGPA